MWLLQPRFTTRRLHQPRLYGCLRRQRRFITRRRQFRLCGSRRRRRPRLCGWPRRRLPRPQDRRPRVACCRPDNLARRAKLNGRLHVMSAAENLGEALALLDRYSRIANEAVHMKLTATPEGLVVEIGFFGLPRPLGGQGAEFLMELLFRGHPEVVDADLADYLGSIRPLQ